MSQVDPPTTPAQAPPPTQAPPPGDGGVSTLIPYRNAPALTAYYLAVFSLIPCLGALLGIAAFILGIVGLRRAAEHPEAKGKVHAWIGIILGAICAVVWLTLAVLGLIGMIASA